MINAGNPSAANLQMRKYMKENKQTSAQIFEKLNRRGRLNPAQNAMSAQLTNEQLLRFYVKETVPKLQYNNDDIQGQGGDTNSVLMSEIQRLIDVGNFNAEDAKGNMNNVQTNLIAELQKGFTSVNDSIADNLMIVKSAVDDIADNLSIYSSTNDASSQNIITSLNDLNTKLEQYNTTGTVSQGALFTSLTNLQTALANSNTNNAANTAAIDNLSIILGSMGSTPGINLGGGGVTTPPVVTPPVVTPPAPAPAPAPAPPVPVLPPIPLLPPPPSPSTSIIAPPSLSGALGGLGGASTISTSSASGITSVNLLVPPIAPTTQQQVDAAVTAAADVKGAGGSVMVPGPKVPIGVGSYPEYDAIMAKNGGKPLISKDYKEILYKLAEDQPKFFTEAGNKKITTYINSLNKTELVELSEKVLAKKYKYSEASSILQSASRRTTNTSIRNELGTIMDANRDSAADIVLKATRKYAEQEKFRSIMEALKPAIVQQKFLEKQAQRQASTLLIQTAYRNRGARQEFERQRLIGPSLFAQPELYSLVPGMGPLTQSTVFDPSIPFNQAEFDAFFNI
jgi:uncharacterized protein (DUF1778 family)